MFGVKFWILFIVISIIIGFYFVSKFWDDQILPEIFEAIQKNDTTKLKSLISQLSSPTTLNRGHSKWLDLTPLSFAILNGHLEAAKILIEAGANVDTVDKEGDTLLYSVSVLGNLEAVKLLVEADVNVNTANTDGKTALHAASINGNLEIVTLLVEAGDDIKAADEDGDTPLHCAYAFVSRAVIKFLIKAGANVDATNKSGETPKDKTPSFGEKMLIGLSKKAMQCVADSCVN